jgi:hypothetical protein
MKRDVIFILSSWRAGSTLLQRVLNGHSRLLGLHELHLPFLELPCGERSFWSRRRRRVVRMARLALEAYGVRAGTRELLHPDPACNRATFDRLAAAIRERYGKEVLVEKTPDYSLNVASLDRVFPEGVAKVFLVRSPGGVAFSCHQVNSALFPTIGAGLAHWFRYYTALERYFQGAPPGSHLRVRYEDLVSGDGPARAVTGYLGVPFEPAMLEYGLHGQRSALTGVARWGDPSEKLRSGKIDPENAERWRAHVEEEVNRWFRENPEAARLAETLGYPSGVLQEAGV